MEHTEFRVKAKEMVDYIADYLENIRDRRVYPSVQPGYLHKLLPKEAPQTPEKWDEIFKDVDEHIMPGLVHWQSPHMHAYFPALTSYPSIMGEMLSSALNVLCFTWASSPAGTELETIAMNWLGKLLGLPDCFLNEKNDSPGGGVIQTTASEATLVSLLAARTRALMELSKLNPEVQSAELLGHLICYCSDQAHSSVEKAGLIGLVRMRYIESDEHQSMRGDQLEKAIASDKEKGLVPFWVCATLGTTGSVAFDNLREIGQVCEKHGAWLHVDAAYAGSAFTCPEYRHWLDGVELADSFAFNPSKWLMVNFDCTAMWVKDSTALHRTFNVNPIYLRHENSGKAIDYMVGDKQTYIKKKPLRKINNNIKGIENPTITINGHKNHTVIELETPNPQNGIIDDYQNGDYHNGDNENGDYENGDYNGDDDDGTLHGYNKISQGCGDQIQLEDPNKKEMLHWQIPLSRRFRALKLWFVLRNYGVSGIQKHIREGVRLAQKFEALVLADQRFEIPQPRNLGMVAFRLKGDNALTERLLKRLNARGYMHAVPACFKGIYVIRFTVTSSRTTNQDILDDWNEIKTVAKEILMDVFGSENGNIVVPKKPRISLKETRELNATFGTSLLLANSPMSPKIVNGTHAAICDYEQVLTSCAQTFAQLKMEPKDSPEMRRRIRGIKMCGKKFSLDSCMDMVQGMMVEQSLPQCCEDEREDTSNGSSPGDKSSITSSPLTSIGTLKQEHSETNQLQVPLAPSRQYRSKSVDVSLAGLSLDDAKITIDVKNNEIIITPTGSKDVAEELSAAKSNYSEIEEKLNIGDKITQAFENFQDGLQMLSEYKNTVEKADDCNTKLTIRGPGSYIKRLIQQFSEGPFEGEDPKPESERAMSTQTIKDKADAICKKCLHYKGKISK
ncbi:histidine decarboxylase isoform X1 [Spodoptera litura]|uniref:Histidine decarboxylase n=1 Tax=Spodoptera litura TaxID=69820 RepID=A0A9J7IJK9_SPOLT|nr:histidine decarboxylase isoform X1 [Spodoptera litura]